MLEGHHFQEKKKDGRVSLFMFSIYHNIFRVDAESYGKAKFKQIKAFKYSIERQIIWSYSFKNESGKFLLGEKK